MRIFITVVAYEAAATIQALLDRVPAEIGGEPSRVLVSDDASGDDTAALARAWASDHPDCDLDVVCQDANLGYGGNQKALYDMARQRGADIVVLLHGDEQYPPEMASELVGPIVRGEADVVHGSRMLVPGGARAGRMPMDRFVGNKVLTRVFNVLADAELSEWFSGFRAYRMSDLVDADFKTLPDGFDFDTAITLRLLENGCVIEEVPIPTRYADEISRVPLLRTGLRGLQHAVASRLGRRARSRRTADVAA